MGACCSRAVAGEVFGRVLGRPHRFLATPGTVVHDHALAPGGDGQSDDLK
jgi:hypothetical protein